MTAPSCAARVRRNAQFAERTVAALIEGWQSLYSFGTPFYPFGATSLGICIRCILMSRAVKKEKLAPPHPDRVPASRRSSRKSPTQHSRQTSSRSRRTSRGHLTRTLQRASARARRPRGPLLVVLCWSWWTFDSWVAGCVFVRVGKHRYS